MKYMTIADLTAWLTERGLVVEGCESRAELDEAYRHLRAYEGNPVREYRKGDGE